MTAKEVLSDYVDEYIRLSSRLGANSRKTTEVFGKLRELMIVEIYFMKSVRMIIKEEDLSGFVLFVENKLRDIVDSFKPGKSEFMTYFKHVMEYRAFNYLEKNRRRMLTAYAYECYYMQFAEEVAERNPEEIYLEEIEKMENARTQKKLKDKLKHCCVCRPSRRKNLFIFLCTILPYLSRDAIDDFCKVLNCSREQTFAIAEHLYSIQVGTEPNRCSREYLRNRKDYLWMRKMEMEYSFEHSDKHNETLLDNIRRIREMLSNIETDRRKMNVEYPVLGRLLNLDPGSIANAVYSSKKLLSAILDGNAPDGMKRKPMKLDRFEPFRVFGITEIKISARYAAAS